MVMTKAETIHGTIQWPERYRNSMAIFQWGCLTQGACVGHWTPDYSAMEATGSAIAHGKEGG